jgi:hypothetical protein
MKVALIRQALTLTLSLTLILTLPLPLPLQVIKLNVAKAIAFDNFLFTPFAYFPTYYVFKVTFKCMDGKKEGKYKVEHRSTGAIRLRATAKPSSSSAVVPSLGSCL